VTDWLPLLAQLYGSDTAQALQPELNALIEKVRPQIPLRAPRRLTAADAMLITYADQLTEPGRLPLATLHDFCIAHLDGLLNCLHLLPFYPSSSDDGFSVIDFRQVDPRLGTWADIARLASRFDLMFDGVINHASAQGEWFQAFLRGDPAYRDYFIRIEGTPDLSQVVRPRALPLLTVFESPSAPQKIWTTFSADQVDLNYANPRVLLEMLDVLLFYAAQGAQFIRLDAIAFLWKQIGTPCIHLPQTHAIIQLLRAVLDEVAPYLRLISETNVPHELNLSYFGDGDNEAQLVYNFALPPLVLHTLHTADARALTAWAASLRLPSDRVTFFNFLASHDGIGLNPVRELLPDSAIDALVQRALAHGGQVSYKQNPDGSQSPYELNINYFDALSDPAAAGSLDLQVARFLAAQAILLSLPGLPGIYFHSLFGSRGWPQGVELTGANRSINRQKLSLAQVEQDLADPASLRSRVFSRFSHLLNVRAACPAFDPQGEQTVLDLGPGLFAILRVSSEQRVLCLQNVTALHQPVSLASASLDLLTSAQFPASFSLAPYQTCWLSNDKFVGANGIRPRLD